MGATVQGLEILWGHGEVIKASTAIVQKDLQVWNAKLRLKYAEMVSMCACTGSDVPGTKRRRLAIDAIVHRSSKIVRTEKLTIAP